MALPYASYPDIVEDVFRLAGREALLTARRTSSTLKAWADRELAGATLFFRSAGGEIVVTAAEGVWEPDVPPLKSPLSAHSPAHSPARSPRSSSRGSSRSASTEGRRERHGAAPPVPVHARAWDTARRACGLEALAAGPSGAAGEQRLPCFHPLGPAHARVRALERATVVVLVDVPPSAGLDALLAHVPEAAHVVILHAQHAPAPAYALPRVARLTLSVTPNCLCGTKLGLAEVGRRVRARRAVAGGGGVSGVSGVGVSGVDVEGAGAVADAGAVGGEARPWWAGQAPDAAGGAPPRGLAHRAAAVHVRLTRLIADPILARASYSQLCAGLSGALAPETEALVLEQQGVMPEPFWNPACLLPLPGAPAAAQPRTGDEGVRLGLGLAHVEIVARALPDFEARSLVERLRARMRRTPSQAEQHTELRRRFAAYFGLPPERVRARELPRCEWKRLHGQPPEPAGRCAHCAPGPVAGLEGVLL